MIPTLVGIATVVFIAIRLAPGDPAQIMLGELATPEQVAAIRGQLGLDAPLYVQFGRFIAHAALGDFGRSIVTNRPVMPELLRLFPNTFYLGITSVFISVLIGLPAGVIAAVKRNTWIDRAVMLLALAAVSMPVFWLGILLILALSIEIPLFPVIGAGDAGDIPGILSHLVLPSLALGGMLSGLTARMTRSSVLEVLRQDYMRTARSKGLPERVVIYKHALKNAMIPVITIVGLNMGNLLGGSVVIETVFARPGIGKLLIDSITARDYIQVQAGIIFIAAVFVIINLLTDLTYGVFDPRIRYS